MPILIEGLTETQDYLYAIEMKLNAIKVEWLDRFAQKVADVAREQFHIADTGWGGIDTGALLASIGNRLLSATTDEIVEEIFAGSAEVIRGAGRFIYSLKTLNKVSVKSTEDYAEIAEDRGKFMQVAHDWALTECEKELDRLLTKVMSGI